MEFRQFEICLFRSPVGLAMNAKYPRRIAIKNGKKRSDYYVVRL